MWQGVTKALDENKPEKLPICRFCKVDRSTHLKPLLVICQNYTRSHLDMLIALVGVVRPIVRWQKSSILFGLLLFEALVVAEMT